MTELQDAIFSTFGSNYYKDQNGQPINGQAVSFVLSSLREKGWKRLGSLSYFESLCEKEGFRIVLGRNIRGQAARIVTL